MISFPDAKKVASLLTAVAEPTRLLIIYRLGQGPYHVGELARLLGVPMVNMSHHLGVMRQAGLIEDEKDGRRVVYRLHPDLVVEPDHDGALAILAVGCYRLAIWKDGVSLPSKPSREGGRRRPPA
jgi:DNA-binding transcriptional ArsR family regulator